VIVDMFDRNAVLGSLKKSLLYGNNKSQYHKYYSSWPTYDDLKAKTNDVLKTLRLKRVEWNIGGRINSFRITLSDGSTSVKIGKDVLDY